ncbi:LytTR family DNA-binding domain-containing protein [Algoriphagus confluentis]|uniref:LytTR family DNA-binding domain-containing protein n=1 Tax=Algoriphagus confluentis TaxID=1697556 RepID=A0ABQ6PS67_9BACT|nr:LytTR family DNA-binding domain-containing protein [Algoriphagus confluentis]
MKATIIDDQSHIRENLKLLLKEFAPEVEVIAEADGVKSGLECLKKYKPELVFLDIEMADGTGFDLLNLVKDRSFRVIFVTGHEGYAIRAFRVAAIDYLLKPVDPDDLVEAVAKAKNQKPIEDFQVEEAMNAQKEEKVRQLVLSDADSVYRVQVEDILRCQSEDNYTRFFLSDGRKLLISKTLKEFAELLEKSGFFRCHQSHLINLAYFDHLDKRDGGTIFLKDGSTVPLATRKKDQLLQALREA